ncbi:MAG: hypothetical protein U5K56_19265 [Halioglobus sp.]|nr:hypothetical protein [Halioglobus sp.]
MPAANTATVGARCRIERERQRRHRGVGGCRWMRHELLATEALAAVAV